MSSNNFCNIQVRRLPQVYFVEKEQKYRISRPEWHLDRIDQRKLPLDRKNYCPEYSGAGVDIYIVDSGIRYSHEEIEGRAKYGGFDFDPSSAPDGPGSDCLGHGTHVAALAGGLTVGSAPCANLYSIRIFGCNGFTSTQVVLAALDHVIRYRISSRSTIMSMSFGGPYSQSINLYVAMAYWSGIIPVAAAGNWRFDACYMSPASSPYAITVAATDIQDRAAYFTNYGRCVNIFAPGDHITSASHLSDNGYTVKSGTSMAAPLVSGAAAVLLSKYFPFGRYWFYSRVFVESTPGVVNFSPLPPSAHRTTPNLLLYVRPHPYRCE